MLHTQFEKDLFRARAKPLLLSIAVHATALAYLLLVEPGEINRLEFWQTTVYAGNLGAGSQSPLVQLPPAPRFAGTVREAEKTGLKRPPPDERFITKDIPSSRTQVPAEFLELLQEADVGVQMPPPDLASATSVLAQINPAGAMGLPDAPRPPAAPPMDIPPEPAPVRIGGRLESARAIKTSSCEYTQLALTVRLEGEVKLQTTIGEAGDVEDIRVVDGHPLLADAAVRCVEKWRYRAARLNGEPVPSPLTIRVRFVLRRAP